MSNTEIQEAKASGPNDKQEMKQEVIEFVKMIAWFLVLFFIVKTYVVEGYEVEGPSMLPTLQERERILVLKLPHILSQFRPFAGLEAIEQGNIIVFESPAEPNKRYVKRVIAKGPPKGQGNTVEAQEKDAVGASDDAVTVLFDRGTVFVNNRRLTEDYLRPEQKASDESLPELRLSSGCYYVLGDNRTISKDSRRFGQVDDKRVIGKAVLCFWPPNKFRLLR